MAVRFLRSWLMWALLAALAAVAIYSLIPGGRYEYEEVIALELDGSATVDVNASVAALSAMHGIDLDLDRPQLDRVEALFAASGLEVSELTTFRRKGRRFVHVSLDVEDIRQLPASAPFAGSAFRFIREGEAFVYRQEVARPPASRPMDASGAVPGGSGAMAAIRVRVPSKILFENATSDVQRGNIVVWEQPLADRLSGAPLALHVEMETESILYSTLVLFGATIGAAAIAFVVVIGLVVRKGRRAQAAGAGERVSG